MNSRRLRRNADDKLRELQRLAKQGDVQDKARYLQELVRTGLPRVRVYVAARLGNAEAALVNEASTELNVPIETLVYDALRWMSGAETQEFLRQFLLEITKGRTGTFLPADKRWLRSYLKKGTWPTNLTRVLSLYNDYAFHLGTLVFYWYQPPQYRIDPQVQHDASRLARALTHPWHGTPPSSAVAMGNFLLYGDIHG